MKSSLFTNTSSNRDKGIETLRGMAIIFMVAGHVIGSDYRSGLKVPDNSWFRYFYYSFEYLRMPLFTVISGFVYAMRPISTSAEQKKFINRKIVRLLIPFFIAVTLLCVFQFITPGTNAKLPFDKFWRAYVFPYAQFWFVQGIFIVFILISFLETGGVMKNFKGWLLVFSVSILLFYTGLIKITFFSLDRAPFLLMFFLLGLGMKRFYNKLFDNKMIAFCSLLVFLIGIGYQQFLYFNDGAENHSVISLLTILVGSTGAFLLVMMRFYNPALAWIGNYSYEIFLYHSFGTAGSRIFMKLLGISNLNIYFTICLIMGISLPILFRIICGASPLLTTILFGEKRNKSRENIKVKQKEAAITTTPY